MEGRKFPTVLVPNNILFAHRQRIAKHFTSMHECMRARLGIRVILRAAKVLWSEGVTLGKDVIWRRFWVTPGFCRWLVKLRVRSLMELEGWSSDKGLSGQVGYADPLVARQVNDYAATSYIYPKVPDDNYY